MQLTFVGCGSAFNKMDGQTNMLLTASNGKNMMIDCGTYASFYLENFGIDKTNYAEQIDALYISHQHADHNSF